MAEDLESNLLHSALSLFRIDSDFFSISERYADILNLWEPFEI